jgi:DNA-binding response OmpR family regulator
MTMSAINILLLDDDKPLSAVVKEYLESKNFSCTVCHNVRDGKSALIENDFQLCLLDVKMPMEDGFHFAELLNRVYPGLPFIFLTGQVSTSDRIKGLEAGAQDYIVKPFSMRELLLRIKNVLNRQLAFERTNEINREEIPVGNLMFYPIERKLTSNDKSISLTWIEVKLLQLFCENKNGIILRDDALEKIWSDEHHFKQRSLNVYVSRLRQYLKMDPNIEIKNIHGKGYQLTI